MQSAGRGWRQRRGNPRYCFSTALRNSSGAMVFTFTGLAGIPATTVNGSTFLDATPIEPNMPWAYLTNNLDVLASQTNSWLMPISLLTYELMVINLVLGVFNLIPVPPLDGSHVLRHLLPEPVRRVYDTMGWFALLALVYFGRNFLGLLIFPVLGVFNSLLMRM